MSAKVNYRDLGRIMRQNGILLTAVITSIAASYIAFMVAPTEQVLGDLYRILYIHVPVAWVGYLGFIISLIASLLFLSRRNHTYDAVAEVSAILGLVYGALALISGSIWANAAWGTYWNWDPRETTTLILWIAYVGYISIKLSIPDIEKKMVIGAIYNILAFSTVPLSYISIQLVPTLHPQIVSFSGISMTGTMIVALLLNIIASSLFFAYLLIMASKVWHLEKQVMALTYEKEFGGV